MIHTFRDCQGRTPLVSQDIQTNASVGVDVGVVDACGECNLGRLEGIICEEVYGEEEDTAGVRGVGGTHDGRLPVEKIISDRTGRAGGGWITVGCLC